MSSATMSPKRSPPMVCFMSPTTMSSSAACPTALKIYAQPTDVALVNDVLRPWVTSGDTKSGGAGAYAYVHAADLYAADPEQLARRFQPAVSTIDGECAWYFLCPLRCRSARDRRKVRAVADGAGCWHSEAGPRNVVEDCAVTGGRQRLVGYRQSFSFMRRGAVTGAEGRTGWIMAEFHLHHGYDSVYDSKNGGTGTEGRKIEGLVLCKMYRSPRNRCPAVVIGDGSNDVLSVCSGVSPIAAAEQKFSCGERRSVDDEVFDAVSSATRLQRDVNNSDSDGGGTFSTPTSSMMTVPPTPPLFLNKKATEAEAEAVDDEVSGATTTAAGFHRGKKASVALAVDNEDMPAHKKMKKMRAAVEDGESSVVESVLRKAIAGGGAPAAAAQLQYCPQCGFHLAALQAIVALAKSRLDLAVARGDVGHSEIPYQ